MHRSGRLPDPLYDQPPKDASRKLIDTIAAQDHLCKHIHLPVQSGSDRILKEMNRHYTVAQYMDLVNYAKEKIPGVTFSSDIIVGFPGETEEDFQATLDLIQQVKYMQLFTFIYSKRTGTIAAKLPDPATHAEKAARMDRLLKLQDSIAFPMIAAMAGADRESVGGGCWPHPRHPERAAG